MWGGLFPELEITDCDDTRSLTLWAYLSATRFRIGLLAAPAEPCNALPFRPSLLRACGLLTRARDEPGIPARMPLEVGRSGSATEPNQSS